MALLIQRVLEGEDVGVRDGLHQSAADVRRRGALASGPPETPPCLRIDANAKVEPRVDVDGRDSVRQTRGERGPNMLHDTAEIDEVGGAWGEAAEKVWLRKVRSRPVEGIEEGVGRIGRWAKVAKERKGRGPPCTGDGPSGGVNRLVLIGCPPPPGRRVERRKLEVGRRRTRGSRDG